MQDLSPGVVQDQENVEHSECGSRHGEEVDGDDIPGVVCQEGLPRQGGTMLRLDHVLRNGGLANVDAQLEKLTMDAGCAPQGIGLRHLPDQLTYLT